MEPFTRTGGTRLPVWGAWYSIALALALAVTAARGQGLPLSLHATVATVVLHPGREFSLFAVIRNVSGVDLVLQTDACGNAWRWRTDRRMVNVVGGRRIPCKKNPLQYLRLRPGKTYELRLTLIASEPRGNTAGARVSFRLGCTPLLGYNAPARTLPYIWSNPVAVRVGR